MKFKKLLMVGYANTDFSDSEWKRFDALSESKVLLPKDTPKLLGELKDTDCLLVRLGATVDKAMIDAAPGLKYIGMYGTGYGRVDAVYAATKGIAVCNIAGYSTEGVAELAFGILIDYLRELERAKVQARNGDYSEATFAGTEIKDKNFGVIGLGRIGERIAEIAQKGFGASTSYWSRNRKQDYEQMGIVYKDIDALLAISDFLSLNLALVPETTGFLNKERIQKIKSGATIINLAPMELVDIPALAERLAKRDIIFILDHSDELSPENAKLLAQYKNCIMYPPIGYVTKEATAGKKGMFIDNLENYLNGKPSNKVN